MRIECEKYFHSHIICLVSCFTLSYMIFTMAFNEDICAWDAKKEKFKKCKIERENAWKPRKFSLGQITKLWKMYALNFQKWIYHAETMVHKENIGW